MRCRTLLCAVLGVMILAVSGFTAQASQDTVKLHDRLDSLSYILGRDVGAQLKSFGMSIRMSPFALGADQALRGVGSLIDSQTANSIRQEFAAHAEQHIQQEQQVQAEKNKKLSDAFLAKNKSKPGVKTTKSGLQYKVLENGKGTKPIDGDSVMVLYKAMLMDSTVIDSSTDNQPAVFDSKRIIPGLAEGLKLMNVGSRYRFFVPPELAYGAQGAPPKIPPSAVMIFDVTLVKIAGPEQPKSEPPPVQKRVDFGRQHRVIFKNGKCGAAFLKSGKRPPVHSPHRSRGEEGDPLRKLSFKTGVFSVNVCAAIGAWHTLCALLGTQRDSLAD